VFDGGVWEGPLTQVRTELDGAMEDGVTFDAEEGGGAGGTEHHGRLFFAVGAHARWGERGREGGRGGE
jgi:hypothetical protein